MSSKKRGHQVAALDGDDDDDFEAIPVKRAREENKKNANPKEKHGGVSLQPFLPPQAPRVPSAQQLAIIGLTRPPPNKRLPNFKRARIFRAVAAAGAGKTTTFVMMAQAYLSEGHKSKEINYLVMNKIASSDALIRMKAAGLDIVVKTMHACAHMHLEVKSWGAKLLSDEGLDAEVSKLCKADIDKLIAPLKYGKKMALRRICFFICQTLRKFMRSSHSQTEGFDPMTDPNTCYYPATVHEMNKTLHKKKAEVLAFYLGQAKKVWLQLLCPSGTRVPRVFTYESLIKVAQLKRTKIPCTALMVDESQDMTPCQLQWLYTQAKDYDIDTSFVGDPAQCLYRFAGAKPELILNMHERRPVPIVVDRHLTLSFRFGTAIACLANLLLYAKSKSPQSLGKHSFRVTGGGPPGEVTTRNLADECGAPRYLRHAVISRSNMGLMSYALKTMAEQSTKGLKFCVLGDSKTKWKHKRSTFNLFRDIMSGASQVLPMYPWEGKKRVTWAEVGVDVETFKLTTLCSYVTFLNTHGNGATTMFDDFMRDVIAANYSQAEADIILSTPHAAKGLEWDRVQVLNDFGNLANVQVTRRGGDQALFDFQDKRDDWINAMYVAVTRGRFVVSVSPKIMALVWGLEALGVAGRAIIAEDKARVQLGPAAPPLCVTVTPPGQPARPQLLGLERSARDVRIMYDMIYAPLLRPSLQLFVPPPVSANQCAACLNQGLVIDGVTYLAPGP